MKLDSRQLKKAAPWIIGATSGLIVFGNLLGSLYLDYAFLKPRRKRNKTSDLTDFIPETTYDTSCVQFRSSDGIRLSALVLKPLNSNGHAVLICHGLAHDKYSGVRFVQYLLCEGYTLMLIDFRNHGDSEGWITSYGYFEKEDLLSAVRYLREFVCIQGRIGILGASMGASIALLAAAETEEIKALVLDSPFASLKQMTYDRAKQLTRLPGFLLTFPVQLAYVWLFLFFRLKVFAVEPGTKAKQLRCPLLLIHGGSDPVIPVSHSHEIFSNATVEKELWIEEQADHLGVYLAHTELYQQKVLQFFRKNLIEVAS